MKLKAPIWIGLILHLGFLYFCFVHYSRTGFDERKWIADVKGKLPAGCSDLDQQDGNHWVGDRRRLVFSNKWGIKSLTGIVLFMGALNIVLFCILLAVCGRTKGSPVQ